MVTISKLDTVLESAQEGITNYLDAAKEAGQIDDQLYESALKNTYPNLEKWLKDSDIDEIPQLKNLKKGIVRTIEQEQWQQIINAFRQEVRFGTGGIRGMMAFDKESIIKMKNEGIDTDILKGPNTINDLVFRLTTAGVAQFGKAQDPPLERVVVGYDSRIRGHDFARIVAEVFLAYGYTIYFFDAPCPYPEVTFAIPSESVKADIGVLISASHNDYRYNGYKLSCSNGSQFDPRERDEMYNQYIRHAATKDIKILDFKDAPDDKVWFLGGDEPVDGFDYAGKKGNIINMHERHLNHMKTFLLMDSLPESQSKPESTLQIAFCPFHGAGYIAVPRLLREVGFREIKSINGNKSNLGLNELNGLFPAFRSDPGKEQQPDPGDPRAAATAVKAFKEDYPNQFDDIDILIGTDPDADRCGIVVKIPEKQRRAYNNEDWYLLPADDMWSLVLWYRLHMELEKYGEIQHQDERFITLSHTTSEAIISLARKYDIGVIRTWVGFAALAAATRDVWNDKEKELLDLVDGRDEKYVDLCHPFVCEAIGFGSGKRTTNMAAIEQSNGFSILGGPPPDNRSLGVHGHVRDKDGTFAALLVAEIAAWAKEHDTDIIGLLDRHIYLDPDIGLYATFYEPDPLDGEYPGIEGDRIKKNILLKAQEYHKQVKNGDFEIAGNKVLSSVVYRTGKYDQIYPPSADFEFPDEGFRFFFDEARRQHLTIRPSGTGNSLRFHIQLHAMPTEQNLIETKAEIRKKGKAIMDELRELLDAPRG